jgi:hypothetical protein
MGEKCPDCGERTEFVGGPIALCMSLECDTLLFKRGRGGRTDSICHECLAAMVAPDEEVSRSAHA